MKFDLIIGNPPYNKGTVKRYHPVYCHKAMNAGREGSVGFYIDFLKQLEPNGILSFVTPIKFLRGPGCTKLRQFLFKNYKLISVKMKDAKIFKGVGCDKIGITTWTTGVTDVVNVDGVIIDPYKMPDLIVPAFESQAVADQYLLDIQNGLLGRPIGGPKPANQNYKVVFAKTFMRGFRIEQPGYALGFYENAYEFQDHRSAEVFLDHVSKMVFAKRWSAVQFQSPGNHVDSHTVSRYMPVYSARVQACKDTHLVTRYMPYYDPIDVSRHSYTTMEYLPNYSEGIQAMRQSDFVMRYLPKLS